jgi:hypothetical protein
MLPLVLTSVLPFEFSSNSGLSADGSFGEAVGIGNSFSNSSCNFD